MRATASSGVTAMTMSLSPTSVRLAVARLVTMASTCTSPSASSVGSSSVTFIEGQGGGIARSGLLVELLVDREEPRHRPPFLLLTLGRDVELRRIGEPVSLGDRLEVDGVQDWLVEQLRPWRRGYRLALRHEQVHLDLSRVRKLRRYPSGGSGTVSTSIPSRSGLVAGRRGKSGGVESLIGGRTYRMNRLFGRPQGIVMSISASLHLRVT